MIFTYSIYYYICTLLYIHCICATYIITKLFNLKRKICKRSCLFFYLYIWELYFWYICSKYNKSTFLYMNIMQIKNNKTLVQMSCTVYIVNTFHLTLHHANFGQFKAKRVLYDFCLPGAGAGSLKGSSF